MTADRQITSTGRRLGIYGFLDRVNAIVRLIAQPSLTQLVLRFGLAVPFWRSGVNKCNGFLELNDVAVLLFSFRPSRQSKLPTAFAETAPGVTGGRRRL